MGDWVVDKSESEWTAEPRSGLTSERKKQLAEKIAKNKADMARIEAESPWDDFGSDVLTAAGSLAGDATNTMSLGAYRALRDTAGAKVAPETVAGIQAGEEKAHKMPGYELASASVSAPAAGLGGPGQIYQRIAAPVAARAAANPILQSLVRGGVGGGLTSATQAVVEGAPIAEQGKAALTGAAYGAALDVIPTGLTEGASAVTNSRGGKARQLIEKHGGEVGPRISGKGGPFARELAGLETNDRGIGEAAQRSGERVLDATDQIHEQNVARPYREEKATIDAEAGQKPVAVDDVHKALMEVYQSPRLSVGQRGVIAAEIDNLDKRYLHPQLGIRIMTESQLNDFKTLLNSLSKAGQAGQHTIPQAELGNVAKLVRDKVSQGPYGELNAKYHEGMGDRSDLRAGLGLAERESSNRGSDATRVRNVLARQTQDTTTAGASTMDLPALKRKYPQLERDIELPDVLGAKADLEFKLAKGGHGGLKEAVKNVGGIGALTNYLVHAGLSKSAAVGLAAHLVMTNAQPIAGRLLYGPAKGIQGLVPKLTNPILEAATQTQARKSRLGEEATRLMRGGQ